MMKQNNFRSTELLLTSILMSSYTDLYLSMEKSMIATPSTTEVCEIAEDGNCGVDKLIRGENLRIK